MGTPVDSNPSINKQVDDYHYSAKELRQKLEQETRRSRSRAVNPTEISIASRFNNSKTSLAPHRASFAPRPSLGPLPANLNALLPYSYQKKYKHSYPVHLADNQLRLAQKHQAASMANPEDESRYAREREVTTAITQTANKVSPKAFVWCGIPLSEAFMCPTSRHMITPEEHNGIFKSKKHARQYGKLVRAFMKEAERLKLQQKDDFKAERARCQTERDTESDEFHTEFLDRLSWGRPDCVLYLDPDCLKEYMDRLKKEKLDSRFPTINQYFRRFPTLSISWAVSDFYEWQKVRYIQNENLIRIRHLWNWYETCYKFMHAAYLLRKEHETTLQSWFYCLNSKSKLPDEVQRKAAEAVELIPERDEQRKILQFTTVKKIWKMCLDSGYQFPLDFCPGGMTPMAYFRCMAELRGQNLDFGNPKTLFLRSRTRFDRRTIEGLEVENEIQMMLSNYDTPQEYYKQHPYSLTNVIWEYHSIEEDIDENEMLHNFNDESEVASLDMEDHNSDDFNSPPMPGTYPGFACQVVASSISPPLEGDGVDSCLNRSQRLPPERIAPQSGTVVGGT